MNWLTWLLPSNSRVSMDWLKHQDRRASRIEYHGVVPKWPMRKLLDESPIWNRAKLRKVS